MKNSAYRNLALACLVLFAGAQVGRADLIGLTLLEAPDILASFITIDYDAGTDAFSATGTALTLENPVGSAANITLGTFDIWATIDASGTASAGALTIEGSVDGYGTSLLTGDLTGFGFFDGGTEDLFEFTFSLTGGDLAIPAIFGGLGSTVGVILSAGLGSSFIDFTDGFGNWGLGTADVAVVPAPGAVGLAAMGLGMVGWVKRRVVGTDDA